MPGSIWHNLFILKLNSLQNTSFNNFHADILYAILWFPVSFLQFSPSKIEKKKDGKPEMSLVAP